MADAKITELNQMTTAVGTDRLVIVDDPGTTPETQYIEVEDLITSVGASAAVTTAGTATTSVVTPDGLAGSGYGKVVVQADLCNSATLTTSNKAYIRVPAKINGFNLVAVAASCASPGSTSGAVTITVSNGATSMLSTNLTIDQSETDSSTAATAAVINTAEDDVATGDQIIIAVTGAGTAVTYCVVELTFQLP